MSAKGIKRKALTIEQKIKILKEVDENPQLTRVQIAKKLDLPVTTLNGIVTKRASICSGASMSLKSKKMKKGKYEEVEEKLLVWFKQARVVNIPINGTILREKAEEISQKLGVEFVASNGWIDRLKKRAGLVYRSVNGESKSVDVEEVNDWKSVVLPGILSGYRAKDIFNMDECGLFFNLLPNKTYVYKGEKCHGGKSSKERLTVLLGSNMDGSEKLPLLVIGKSKNPRCFKNIQSLPCKYKSNKTAWMTMQFYEEYLTELDKKMKKDRRKILLFVDNCAAHSKNSDHLQNVKVVMLPANSTSVLQPMDQGVINVFKKWFRKHLVYWLLQKMEESEKLPKLNVLEAMHFIVAAWEAVTATVIANCFFKAGFADGDITEEYDLECCETDWQSLQKKMNFSATFEEYVNVDNDVTPCEILSLDDICKKNDESSSVPESDSDEEEEGCSASVIPNYANAVKGFEVFRQFIESKDNVPGHVFKCLRQLDSYCLQFAENSKKQSTLDKYFCKTNVD